MTGTYDHPPPAELVTHVTAICGRAGEEWLNALPKLVGDLERLWSIKARAPFAAGEFNFVAPAVREGGELCVLKISPPYKTIEIFGEAAFLKSRDGNGAVRLLAEDKTRLAILIEYAAPGKNLAEQFAENKAGAVEPAIDVLKAILQAPPADSNGIKTLDDWFDGLRKSLATEFPVAYTKKALGIYDTLSAQTEQTFYLHGDYHPGNVVTATRAPYLAIDPKGIIGHIGYEIAVFLNNLHWWQETEPDVKARLDRAIFQFSNAFGIDPVELRQWAFAQMVLGAWWSFDEMPEYYSNEVAKADVWDV